MLSARFSSHNRFWTSINDFLQLDKHLADLRQFQYVHGFTWSHEVQDPGVYILYGPRQIGKSTSLKLYIKDLLLNEKLTAKNIFYLACDSLSDRQDLSATLQRFFTDKDSQQPCVILIDEVTYIEKWEIAMKALIDEGLFRNSRVLITGSDSILLEDASAAFPGIHRRLGGKDFHILPLTFREFLELIHFPLASDIRTQEQELIELFEKYLRTGGYPNAINEFFKRGSISESLYAVYQQWLISDFLRKGKNKRKLIELLATLYPRMSSTLSYNTIAKETASLSTDTVIDYLDHLQRLGLVRVLFALDQNKLSPSPKKDKKIHFADPLYSYVVFQLLQAEGLLSTKDLLPDSTLVEGVVADFCARCAPTYYIKAEGEVDIAMVRNKGFLPIEVKWRTQTGRDELKQLRKYPNGLLLRKNFSDGKVDTVSALPVIRFLLQGEVISPRLLCS